MNISGNRFGLLVARQRTERRSANGSYYWICDCGCGGTIEVPSNRLKIGHTRSCGCLRSGPKQNGRTESRLYQVWHGIRQRCQNPKSNRFQSYGGRGISLDQRWESYEVFLEDMGEPPTDKHSIERIDNDAGYGPTNCRWATSKEQAANRRNNVFIEYSGKRRILSDVSRDHGIAFHTLWCRIFKYKWPIDKAIETPVRGA